MSRTIDSVISWLPVYVHLPSPINSTVFLRPNNSKHASSACVTLIKYLSGHYIVYLFYFFSFFFLMKPRVFFSIYLSASLEMDSASVTKKALRFSSLSRLRFLLTLSQTSGCKSPVCFFLFLLREHFGAFNCG